MGAELTGWAPAIGWPLTGYIGLGLTGAWGGGPWCIGFCGMGGADTWAVALVGGAGWGGPCWWLCVWPWRARGSSAVHRLPSPTASFRCSIAVGAMPSSRSRRVATIGTRLEPPTRNTPASWLLSTLDQRRTALVV